MEYFRFPKELHDSALWGELRPEAQKLFLFLLCNIAHKTTTVRFMQSSFELKRGDYITTIRTMAELLKMSNKTLFITLNALAEAGLIFKQTEQARNKQGTRPFMFQRTRVSIVKPELYVGSFTFEEVDEICVEYAKSETLIRNEKEENEFIKTKKREEAPKCGREEEADPALDLNPASRNYRKLVCDKAWVRALADVTEEPYGEIEKRVLRFAQMKYFEGNRTLSTKLFRYSCGNHILKTITYKNNKNHGKKRSEKAERESLESRLPQYQPARIDPARVPGYRAGGPGDDDGEQ